MMQIEFKTNNLMALEFPPVPAKKMIPEWYKDVPEHVIDDSLVNDAGYIHMNQIISTKTIKSCVPVLDYLTSGYIIRAHAEMLITPKTVDGLSTYAYISADGKLEAHSHSQCPVSIDNQKKFYMKYINQWMIKVPKGYSCLFYQPSFFMEKKFTLFPAIVDCDVFDDVVNFPGYINAQESFYINPGDPIMAVFPFKRDDWSMTARIMTDKEKQTPSKTWNYLRNKYKRVFHHKKTYK
jgi:hypothetical protein